MEDDASGLNVRHGVDKKQLQPFSFKPQDVSTKSSIPSYTKGLLTTQSQHLSENNGSERSNCHPFMSSQQDPLQRTRPTGSNGSQRKLLSRVNFPMKKEDKPMILSRNFDTAPSQMHRSMFSGLSRPPPPHSPVKAHQHSSLLSVDQFVRPFLTQPIMPDDYTLSKPPARHEPQGGGFTRPKSPNAPMFRMLTQSHVPQSTPSLSRGLTSPQHSLMKSSPSRSRSRSAVAYDANGDDDISVMMMRGATEVRNVRAELEEQRREVSHLHSEIETMSKEKEELSRRLDATKAAAKKGLEAFDNRYNDLKSAFESLKAQSQVSFAFVDEARVTLTDLTASHKCITASVEDFQPIFDEYGKGSETKALIEDLQEECMKTQQVAQLLREKLQNAGGDLAEAKGRIAELESIQLSEGQALRVSSNNMLHISEKFTKMATAMEQKEIETITALRNAADSEIEMTSAKERIAELVEVVTAQGLKIESARHLEHQTVLLKTELDDKTSLLVKAESAREDATERLDKSTEVLQEQRTQLCVLQASLNAYEKKESELRTLFQDADNHAKEHYITVQKLQEDLRSTGIREHVAVTKNEQSASRMQTLENEVAALRKDLRASEVISQEATKRFSVLQERFDDQSVTLRITKELSGDLQERLLTSEATFSAKLEALSGKMNLETALLKEQKSNLQTILERTEDQARESSKISREMLQTTTADFERRLTQQDAHHTRLFQLEERRGNQMEKDLAIAKNAAAVLEERLSAAGVDLEEMKTRLDEPKGPSSSQVKEIADLKVRIRELDGVNKDLVQKGKTIDARYKEGDLIDEEKAFVNSLIQMTQSIHEQELVSKGNELRRRDNMIASLNTKIGILESTLARHLQAKAKAETSNSNHSIINLKSFMSSSPHFPSTPLITSVTSPPATVLPIRRVSPPCIETQPSAPAKVPVHDNPARMPLAPLTFTRLATDASDDIIESEDDIPLSESLASVSALGKRDRLSSPVKGDDARPSRRLRAVAKKSEPDDKRIESVVKPKTRKPTKKR